MEVITTHLKEQDYVNEFLLEIMPDANDEVRSWYLTMKETMTRIGIPFYKKTGKSKLFQSMYILKKNNRYYLPLFKEMFIIDGQRNELKEEDIYRRNSIAYMLFEWGMIQLSESALDQIKTETPTVMDIKTRSKIFILPYSKKSEWELVQKYPIGIIKNSNYHNKKRIS